MNYERCLYLCKQARRRSIFKPTLDRENFFLSEACFGKTASVYILLIFPNFSILVLRSRSVPLFIPWCLSLLYLWRRPSGELQPVCSAPLCACSWGQPLKIQNGNLPCNIINSYIFFKVKLGSVISGEKAELKRLKAGWLQLLILKSAGSSHQFSKINQKDDSRTWTWTWTCTLGHFLHVHASTAGHADPCAVFRQYHVPSCYCLKKLGFKYTLHGKLLIWFLPISLFPPPGTQTHTSLIRPLLHTEGKYMQFSYLCFIFIFGGGLLFAFIFAANKWNLIWYPLYKVGRQR